MTCRPRAHFAAFVLAAGLTEHHISEMARKNGLPGMQQACSAIDGQLTVRQHPRRGTSYVGKFPRTECQPAAQCGVSPAVNRERKGFHIRLARVGDTGLIG